MTNRDDDDREMAQRDCECWYMHDTGIGACACSCHAPGWPSTVVKVGEHWRPWAMRYVCTSCYDGTHSECDGNVCECKRCAYDDN